MSLFLSWAAPPAAAIVPRKPGAAKKTAPSSKPITSKPVSLVPQVELYVPSFATLVAAARRSHSAEIVRGLVAVGAAPGWTSDDEFDLDAALALLKEIGSWPDTSLAAAFYTLDPEGRPRWVLRVDWPLARLRTRFAGLLRSKPARKALKNVSLRERPGGDYVLALPDITLAVLTECDGGSLIASDAGINLPPKIYGRKTARAGKSDATAAADRANLIYCRLNTAADSSDEAGFFPAFSVLSEMLYSAHLTPDGNWNERFSIRWNPLVGLGIKSVVRRVQKPYPCPRSAFASAVLRLTGSGAADGLSGLSVAGNKIIGARASEDFAVCVLPGEGFLPFPDVFFQFRLRGVVETLKSIRRALEDDAKRRTADDRPLAWHEIGVGGRPVFWFDPTTDLAGGSSTYRTVILVEPGSSQSAATGDWLVVAYTTVRADDFARHWRRLAASRTNVSLPDRPQTHWQGRINWRSIYEFVHPYLTLLAGLSENGRVPPSAEELGDALSDSILSARIELNGMRLTHNGPLPLGIFYVPTVVYSTLESTDDPRSESAREQEACRKLRALYHHARLFHKDFGRWPASVAELDGYVDFASHPDLLSIRPPKRSVLAGFVALAVRARPDVEDQPDPHEIDDSLYVIRVSGGEWTLRLRPGEFKRYQTIYVDSRGEIHRVPLERTAAAVAAPTEKERN